MKKLVTSIIAFVLLLSLCACGNKSISTNSSTTNIEEVSSSDSEVSSTPDPKTNATEIDYEQEINTDDLKITFTNHAITTSAYYEREDGTALNLEDTEDDMYFLFSGEVQNLATNEIDFYNNVKIELWMDNKYNYPVSVDPIDLISIIPLKSQEFLFYAEAPKEVLDACTEYSLYIGFTDGLQPVDGLSDCDNLFVINGTMEEYGSIDNIQNFQMLTEYLDKSTKQFSPDLHTGVYSDLSYVKCYYSNIGNLEIDSTGTFTVLPALMVNYLEGFNMITAEFEIEIEESPVHTDDNIYYTKVQKITISSDNGSYSMDDSTSDFKYNYNSTLHTSDNIFYFDPEIIDYNQLKEIINGANATIISEIVSSDGSVYTEELVLDENAKGSLVGLLDFYYTLPLN